MRVGQSMRGGWALNGARRGLPRVGLGLLLSLATTPVQAVPPPAVASSVVRARVVMAGYYSLRPRAAVGRVPPSAAPPTSPAASAYAPTLRGHVVQFALHGFEPDFDPIYGIVLVLTLHDARPAPLALPDATLLLDLYLEQFQPDTTPILPDLLHPNQAASNLAAFMQGQAVLLNRGGHVADQGDALAEVFASSQVHVVLLNMQPPGASASAPTLRLQGVMTLYKGGTQTGRLQALAPPPRADLAVPRGRMPIWQQIVAGLRVALPPMRGTAGNGSGARPVGSVTPSSASVGAVATAVAGPGRAGARTPRRSESGVSGRRYAPHGRPRSGAAPGQAMGVLVPVVSVAGALALLLVGVYLLLRRRTGHAPV